MDYSEKLRQILNEINAADPSQQDNQAPAADDDDENDNFMDDAGDEDEGGDDTGADADTGDDESDNFMDDSGDEGSDDNNSPPADDDAGDDESDNFMDDGGDEGDNTPEDAGGDEGGDDTGGDTGDEESDNFMDDAGGGDEGGDDTGGGDEGEGSSEEGEQQGEEGQEEDNGYDIEKIEDELFSSLTTEQIAIKNHELKNQFIEIYSIIGSTLVRINDVPKSNDNVNILKFITEKLLELRDMVDYNITTAYNTRTYIENNIIYQQCIATLNAIADIIDNIPGINGGQENTGSEDDDEEDKGEPVEQDDAGSEQLDISDTSVTNYQEESTNYNFLF